MRNLNLEAATLFSNGIQKIWLVSGAKDPLLNSNKKGAKNTIFIDPEDKQYILDDILNQIYGQIDNKQIKDQLLKAFKQICTYDYPHSSKDIVL